MAINKPEQHEIECKVYACSGESGLIAMRSWLYARRDKINEQWLNAEDEELTRLQGEGRIVREQIRMIDKGPTIKETVK